MDIRQLAALVAVAETGTFSAAAARLHTVQSNVSTHIAHLERELGVTLVDRAAGRLTEEGDVVLARARRVQAELDALVADVASLRDEIAGRVHVGIIGTTGRWLLPLLLSEMRARHPRVQVTVLGENTTALLPHLLSGRLDLALVNLPVTDPDVVSEPIFEEDLVLVAPAGHPLADAERVTLAELARHELLLTPPGTSIRVELDAAATAAGVTLQARAEIDGLRLITTLSLEGFGPAVVPSSAVSWETGDTWRRVLISGLGRRQVGLAHRRRRLPSRAARALEQTVLDVIAAQAGA
ncbi:MAG: LysR family transcriptional regulator, partial [Actinomycetota bacterium]|nr:LysR family transcriptional regulator [Actinomycetota bacterium]